MKIAACQMNIVFENREENFKKATIYIEEAVRQGCDLILFPEMSFTGFSMNTELTADNERETLNWLENTAKSRSIAVGAGWTEKHGSKARNHFSVFDQNGSLLSDYIKIHPFSYSGEDQSFEAGQTLAPFELNGINICPFICYDLRFPEIFQAASEKAQIILVPANWPAKRREHWKCLLQARAIENQAFLLGINCVGTQLTTEYSGDSCLFNPDGQLIAEAGNREGILYCESDFDTAVYRSSFPTKRDRKTLLYKSLL